MKASWEDILRIDAGDNCWIHYEDAMERLKQAEKEGKCCLNSAGMLDEEKNKTICSDCNANLSLSKLYIFYYDGEFCFECPCCKKVIKIGWLISMKY